MNERNEKTGVCQSRRSCFHLLFLLLLVLDRKQIELGNSSPVSSCPTQPHLELFFIFLLSLNAGTMGDLIELAHNTFFFEPGPLLHFLNSGVKVHARV